MARPLNIIQSDGTIAIVDVCRLSILLILGAMALVSAMAVNEFFQQVLARYVRKDGLWGYFLYAVAAIVILLVVVYSACRWDDKIVDYINVSPLG